MTTDDRAQTVPLDDVAAGIVRAFEEAAGVAALDGAVNEDRAASAASPDAVKMLDEAFERAQVALGTNVLPFRR